MQTEREPSSHPSFEQVVTILRIAAWVSFIIQVGLAGVSSVLLLLAIVGRSFNQAIVVPGVPRVGAAPVPVTSPGLGVGIFWGVCGVLVLLFGSYTLNG